MTLAQEKQAYLAWVSTGASTLKINTPSFSCAVYKVNEHINDDYLPVISINQIDVPTGFLPDNPAYKDLMYFIHIVDKYNPRGITFLTEVPMYLYNLVDHGYELVAGVVDGKKSHVTLYRAHKRTVRSPS